MSRPAAAAWMLVTPGTLSVGPLPGRRTPAQVEHAGIARDRLPAVEHVEGQVTRDRWAVEADVVPGEGVLGRAAELAGVAVDVFDPDEAAGRR